MMGDSIFQNLKSKLNIRGVVDLDQLSDVLLFLMDHVDKQEKVIADLDARLLGYVNLRTFGEKYEKIIRSLTQIESSIQSVQMAVTAKVDGGKTVAAGDLASRNYIVIEELNKTVAELITRAEVETQYQNVYEIRATNLKIRADLDNSVQRLDQLTKAHASLSSKAVHIESSLSTKLDRSEVDYIESIATKVSLYDDFRTDSIAQLRDLQESTKHAHEQLTTHTYHLQGVDAYFLRVDEQIGRKVDSDDLQLLAKEVDVHDKQLKLCATHVTVEELEAQLKVVQQQLSEAEEVLASTGVSLVDIRGVLSTRASLQDVRACVTRAHHDEAIIAIGADLRTKAPVTIAEQLLGQVQTLEVRVEAESERTSVAVHFVDWFMARGENYEANMQIIDRHLKKLTQPEQRGMPRPQVSMPLGRPNYNSFSNELIHS